MWRRLRPRAHRTVAVVESPLAPERPMCMRHSPSSRPPATPTCAEWSLHLEQVYRRRRAGTDPRRTHPVPCSPTPSRSSRASINAASTRNCLVSRPCRFRYFNVYGPRQRTDYTYAAVIPPFVDALRKERAADRPRRRPLRPGLQLHRRRSRWNNRCRSGPDRSLLGTCLQHRAGRDGRPLELRDRHRTPTPCRTSPQHTDERPNDLRQTWAAPSAAKARPRL